MSALGGLEILGQIPWYAPSLGHSKSSLGIITPSNSITLEGH